MGMTRAELETWLEGWRMVEAVQREERELVSRQQSLAQMFELSELAHGIAPVFQPPVDPSSRLMDPWIRLKTHGANA
jgi:hypothetical protein